MQDPMNASAAPALRGLGKSPRDGAFAKAPEGGEEKSNSMLIMMKRREEV